MAKKTICITTSIEGHYSLAQALQQIFADEYDVHIYLERDGLFDIYLPMYQLFPGLMKYSFHISGQEKIVEFLHQLFHSKYQKKIMAVYRKFHPDLFLNTYFMYSRSLADVTQKFGTPVVNIITDPRTVHPMVIEEKATTNVVFDQAQVEYCQKLVPTGHYDVLGWLVKDEYEQPYDAVAVKNELGLKQDVFTILVTSGSEGTHYITKIILGLFNTQKPIQVVIACGRNKGLYHTMKATKAMLQRTNSNHTVLPIGYTNQLHKYMQAADMVMGKAGPNTLFESVATHTPFFATTHISGHEDGNLEIIRDYHLGYVEENGFKAARLIKKIVEHPELLQQFEKPLAELAASNHQTKQRIKQLVATLIEQRSS